MYIFGGRSYGLCERLNDLWILSLDSFIYTEVEMNDTDYRPDVRSGFGMVYDSDKIWIFGGRGGESTILELNDLWLFDINTQKWQEVHPNQKIEEVSQ